MDYILSITNDNKWVHHLRGDLCSDRIAPPSNLNITFVSITGHKMAELSEMKGQELVDIKEENNEIRFIFKNRKIYSLRVQEGKFVFGTEEVQQS
jgi:hypothetical protein